MVWIKKTEQWDSIECGALGRNCPGVPGAEAYRNELVKNLGSWADGIFKIRLLTSVIAVETMVDRQLAVTSKII